MGDGVGDYTQRWYTWIAREGSMHEGGLYTGRTISIEYYSMLILTIFAFLALTNSLPVIVLVRVTCE